MYVVLRSACESRVELARTNVVIVVADVTRQSSLSRGSGVDVLTSVKLCHTHAAATTAELRPVHIAARD